MAGQQRLEMIVPLIHKIQSAFLHPAVKVSRGDRIRIMKDGIIRRQNVYRSFFHRNSRPAQLRWKRSKVPAVKVPNSSVALHHQRSPGSDKVEQPLIVGHNIFLRVVSANTEHDSSV